MKALNYISTALMLISGALLMSAPSYTALTDTMLYSSLVCFIIGGAAFTYTELKTK